jgi:NIMA (never in mitosis gene a)-related kinase
MKRLGRGAFGSVYLMKSKLESSMYAMKVVKFESLSDKEAANKEIKLLVMLQHPFLTLLNDLYTSNEGKTINILISYCDGGDLSKIIKAERNRVHSNDSITTKGFTGTNILKWFGMACLGLEYLHSNNILHRDIKPENLLISLASKNLKIGDFGLAKLLEHKDSLSTTEVGTTYYISPEVVQSKGYGFPTDVWSLGCVMHELITLALPYYGDTMVQFVECLVYRDREVHERKIDVPDEIWTMVERMLDKDASTRITIPEILSSRVMKKVLGSIIEKHKPADMNSRQIREDVIALKNQVDDIQKCYESMPKKVEEDAQYATSSISEDSVDVIKDDAAEEDKDTEKETVTDSLLAEESSNLSNLSVKDTTLSDSVTNPDALASNEPFDELTSLNSSVSPRAADLNELGDDEELSGIDIDGSIKKEEGYVSPSKLFLEDKKRCFNNTDDNTDDNNDGADSSEPRGRISPYLASSPTTKNVIKSISSSLTDSVISSVLFAARDSSMGRYNRPCVLRQSSNMSLVSANSFDGENAEGGAGNTAGGPRASSTNGASGEDEENNNKTPDKPATKDFSKDSANSIKAKERLERALEYSENADGSSTYDV